MLLTIYRVIMGRKLAIYKELRSYTIRVVHICQLGVCDLLQTRVNGLFQLHWH